MLKRSLLLTAIALATISTVMAGPANAAHPTAYNERAQYLTAYPTDAMNNGYLEHRIYLAAGNYFWFQHIEGEVLCHTDFRLGAGWYTWSDTLDPNDGYYHQTTTLDPDNPAWVNAYIRCDWALNSSGTWTWGSVLDPYF